MLLGILPNLGELAQLIPPRITLAHGVEFYLIEFFGLPFRHCINRVVGDLAMRILDILLDRFLPFLDGFLLRESRLFRVELVFGRVDMEIEVVIFLELRRFFLYLSPLFFPVFVFFVCLFDCLIPAICVAVTEPPTGIVPPSIEISIICLCFDLLELDICFGRFGQKSLRLRFEHEHFAILLALLLQDGFPFGKGLIVAHCLPVFGVQLFDDLFLLRFCPLEAFEFVFIVLDLHRSLDVGFVACFEDFLLLLELLIGFR